MLNYTTGTIKTYAKLIALGIVTLLSYVAKGQDTLATSTPAQRVNLHFQATYIYQYKPKFEAKYSGPNSLKATEEKENSLTATLYLGVRLWKGAEVYINPELAGGSGLSGAFGLGASTNGETFRVGDPAPTLYLARGYFKQTIALGDRLLSIDDQQNQLETKESNTYLRFLLGKLSLGDVFDNNAYANSPRTQFMNWCLMNNGAYDYAANVRGYTYAFVTILQDHKMTYKAALATLPVVANGGELNTNLGEEYSVNAEIDRAYQLHSHPGNIRLLAYRNSGHMGNYAQALQYITLVPDVTLNRQYGRTKTGIGISADQQISNMAGVFLRAGYNDGQNETWVFTEADRSVSAGIVFSGTAWKRKDDVLGIALDVNGLSKNHHDYLAAGGMGFQLGDGTLGYANETAFELNYNCRLISKNIWLSGDYQFILNPGYNIDRGPVSVFSVRLHAEL